ncbi:hypothetical protein HMPREF1035_1398 [Veillonella parvula ATCC 17745]|nr:hypothetical protein HMPREF1035_1398 [Veillonella parvula ATCC 17745]
MTSFFVISARSLLLTRNLCFLPLISTYPHPRQRIANIVLATVHGLFVAILKLRTSTKMRNIVSTNTNIKVQNIANDICTSSCSFNPTIIGGGGAKISIICSLSFQLVNA